MLNVYLYILRLPQQEYVSTAEIDPGHRGWVLVFQWYTLLEIDMNEAFRISKYIVFYPF